MTVEETLKKLRDNSKRYTRDVTGRRMYHAHIRGRRIGEYVADCNQCGLWLATFHFDHDGKCPRCGGRELKTQYDTPEYKRLIEGDKRARKEGRNQTSEQFAEEMRHAEEKKQASRGEGSVAGCDTPTPEEHVDHPGESERNDKDVHGRIEGDESGSNAKIPQA